uniref:Copia protein n=1 Tax=Tanacetum cinerariifolium TaxID=118510 RepID=A0A699GRV4_TANCI|nr:copia protein [Tanacetum cinerariifolium]
MKGIKREFSVPRTPQQNGIAERKNRTLIEAARTMLADSLLPISFWAEAVNTACYVQNRVLLTKPQNKTSYELLLGRTPSIVFMRPFGCPVTILNTLDPLGKFDGKADEGFLVGYSVSSKAFRVFNSRTQIVQETLHINFLENKPNVAGSGPTWLFDIDTLTKSMNYQPVTADNQSNPSAGVQEQFDAEKAGEDNVQQYVIFPLRSSGSKDPQNTDGDATFEVKEPEFEGRKLESEVHVSPSSKFEDFSDNNINEVNAASTSVPTVGQISTNSTNTFSAAGPFNTDEEVYIYQPLGFEDPDYPYKVYKVVKALYGLHQVPRAWYETLANYLLENGFQRGKIDQTLFIKKKKDNILLVQVYVDDIIFRSTNKDLCKAFEKLMKKKFQMSLMGELTFFFGLQVKQKPDGIFISQDKYVPEILRKFGLTGGKSASTPIDTEKPLLKDLGDEDVDVHTYRSMIGSLMYLTSSRPDIMFVVCAYSPFNLVAYSDSDYAGASLDRNSTIGDSDYAGARSKQLLPLHPLRLNM